MNKNYFCKFTPNGWNKNDWQHVGSPRWNGTSYWLQNEDHIVNHLPENLTEEEIIQEKFPASECYVSMLLKQPVKASAFFSTVCSFDYIAAPLLVLSQENGPIYHDHLEIVLYNEGINVWHHFFQDNTPSWQLIAAGKFPLNAKQRYRMNVAFYKTEEGWFLNIECPGFPAILHQLETDWPKTYFVGITACEGINRFYEFELKGDVPPLQK